VPPAESGHPPSVATQDGEGAKQPKDVLYGIIMTVCLLVALGATLSKYVPGILDQGEPSPEVASESAAPGYTLLEHSSGALSVEVPFEWDKHILSDTEGERAGRLGHRFWAKVRVPDPR
jgi:hypothetical protein